MSEQTLSEKLSSNPQAMFKFVSDIALATILAIARMEGRHTLQRMLVQEPTLSPEGAVEQTVEGVEHLLQPFERAFGSLWSTIWDEVKGDLVEGLSGPALALRSKEGFGDGKN